MRRGDDSSLGAPGIRVSVCPLKGSHRGYTKSLRRRRGVKAAGIAFAQGSSGFPLHVADPVPPQPNMDKGTQAAEAKTVLQQPTNPATPLALPRLAPHRRAAPRRVAAAGALCHRDGLRMTRKQSNPLTHPQPTPPSSPRWRPEPAARQHLVDTACPSILLRHEEGAGCAVAIHS